MGGILPTSSDATIERGGEPTLLFFDEERADEVLGAVQSETARSIFRALSAEPMTATDLAETLDASVEGVGYHLDNLEEAGLIDVLDTVYSEKGREMDVYGPPEEPLLLFFGSAEDGEGVRSAFARLVPVVGPVAILVVLERTVRRLFDLGDAV